MSDRWEAEKKELLDFSAGMASGPALPEASDALLEAHAERISHFQNLLSLVASLPPDERPSVGEWDDILGPLWRQLFAKGADIDRYTLASLWRPVLLEAGEVERFLRTTSSVAASARNFYHYDEALTYCAEGRAASQGMTSAALASLINTEGFVRACARDYEGAGRCFEEALRMAEKLPEEELVRWVGLSRTDFLGQEHLNLLDINLDMALRGSDADASRSMPVIRKRLTELENWPLGPGLAIVLQQNRAQLAILEENYGEAKSILGRLYSRPYGTGPYRFSLQAMQCRLLSLASSREGDWDAAYYWIRKALRESVQRCYPAEELFVLDQALSVLKGLHGPGHKEDRDELIRDLVHLLEDKDWYTGRSHSRSVGSLAALLGRNLRNSGAWQGDIEKLGTAGLLHDIGKLMISWSLLNKIAPITPREHSILAEHASHGGWILREIGMIDVAEIVEQHHEAMDGTGYPSGMPPGREASVIAVCDAYEAMITPNRRYKEPKSKAAALAEISAQSGRGYDATVVQALHESVRERIVETGDQVSGFAQ